MATMRVILPSSRCATSCWGAARTPSRSYRWGGDEFLIVGKPSNRRGVEKLAEQIRVGISQHQYRLGGGHVGRLSGSIGFASYPFVPAKPELPTWEQVMNIADQASYIAKNTQRDAWVGIHSGRRSGAS